MMKFLLVLINKSIEKINQISSVKPFDSFILMVISLHTTINLETFLCRKCFVNIELFFKLVKGKLRVRGRGKD